MNKQLIQIYAAREGGRVKRCHILPFSGSYDNAQHSFNAVSLLLLLHPGPSLELIKTLQWHDMGERWFGDMPATAKWSNPELKEVYERLEKACLAKLGFTFELLPEEQLWVKALDTMELWLWCREERFHGNKNVDEWLDNCSKALVDLKAAGKLPTPVALLHTQLLKMTHVRLSDFFATYEPDLADGPGEAPA